MFWRPITTRLFGRGQRPGWVRTGAQIAAAATLAPGILVALTITTMAGSGARAAASSAVSVTVSGNELVTGTGSPLRLLGVNRSGTEYACAQGWGIFDGPSDSASMAAIASWDANAVRVPLNEDCWLGLNGVKSAYSGASYRSAVEDYVASLNQAGLVAILDLHWSAPGAQLALGQQQMADVDHSPSFWSSVADAFKSRPGVVFDLYNEPHDISWDCWLNGCTTASGWQAAGMQSLLNAVRSTGARQPVMVAGLNWGGDLSGWLAHEPADPINQLVAAAHIYSYSQCDTATCWNQTIAPTATVVPVVTGELGETDCAAGFINSYMSWADAHGVSYVGWSWNTASCRSGPALITSYSGAPTAFGSGYESHLSYVASSPTAGGPYVVDGSGGIDPAGSAGGPPLAAPETSASWPGTNIVRGAAALPDASGGYVLDGWGGVHPFAVGSNAMPLPATTSAYWPEQDVARGIALVSAGQTGYVVTAAGQAASFAVGAASSLPPLSTASMPAGAAGRAALVTS
ncbi:MAG: cellulase family glycosylhydrolase [Acidimicrobiales bacterium]|nr:cellulase family glycosylhydrolase [Acidimicrobiales bacterium]